MTTMEASDWSKFSNCRFGIFEQFEDYFTLGQILIRALFQYFFLRKPTSEAHLSNFIFDAFKERVVMVYFEKKIFKRRSDQKLGCPNAHISLVNALIFTCSNPPQPYCESH